MYTTVEENYVKAIYTLEKDTNQAVKTTTLAQLMGHKPSTVTETLDRLVKKHLIWYQKYKGAEIAPIGKELALRIIRRHRLWEFFLQKELDFSWNEVHEIAEELEHINFPLLISRLDDFLGNPKIDPHGQPIPDKTGKIHYVPYKKLTQTNLGDSITIKAVTCDEKQFLRQLDKLSVKINKQYSVVNIDDKQRVYILSHEGINTIVDFKIVAHILVV